LPDERAKERFAAPFSAVEGIWEAIYPDLRLEAHREDYKWLSKVYASIKAIDTTDELLWHRLGAKTLQLVQDHITNVTVNSTGVDLVIADEDTIALLIASGVIDPDEDPGEARVVTAAEVVDNIAARIRRRLAGAHGDHPVYRSLAGRLERLRERQLAKARDSVDYLQEILELARDLTAAERAEDVSGAQGPDLLPDPHKGALTQIFEEYTSKDAPVVIGRVVEDIDAIVKEVRWDGWSNTREGARAVRREIRKVFKKYELPPTGELFDHAYAYIAEHY
jgi:type I restriction enzyme, R subunit